MRKVWAIALLALRGAVRSRVVLLLLAFLLLTIAGLPLTVQGDGTLGGEVQILLRYTLGLAMLILSLASLWAGCASVSLEWQSKKLQLVCTKPIHPFQIWLGKWLGLMLLNTALLAVSGAVTAGLLRWRLREPLRDPAQRELLLTDILVARRPLQPDAVNVEREARARLQEARERGLLPPHVPPEAMYRAVRDSLLVEAFSVPPGGARAWRYPRPGKLDPAHPLSLRFRFSSSTPGPGRVAGAWTLHRGDTGPAVRVETHAVATTPHSLHASIRELQGEDPLVVEYRNTDAGGVTVLFSPEDGLETLAYAGAFAPNYARGLVVLWGQLALLAALGLTAGSLFSMPVAAFVSGFVLLLTQLAGDLQSMAARPMFLTTHHGEAMFGPRAAALFQQLFRALHIMVGPLEVPDAMARLTTGVLVPWTETLRVLWTHGLAYPLVLAGLAAWVMRRREPALAG
ncbi:MAG: ABC transporter permease [Kiritimatiellae bacterium]|nr:ABC transporter permease [Kiritimatiellia bacterium]